MKPLNIVCIAYNTWEGNFVKSTVKLMSLEAEHHHVLFVEYAHTYKDLIMGLLGRSKIPVQRILGFKSRLRKLQSDDGNVVHVLTPPFVPPYNFFKNQRLYDLFCRMGARKVAKAAKKAMARLDMNDPVVVNAFNPFYGNYHVGRLGERLHVYYCYDGINGKRHGARGLEMETQFMQKVDLVICTSDALKEEKSKTNQNCVVVKNGVDFQLFNKVYLNARPKVLPQPVVSYIGSIDQRFEVEFVVYAIEHLPQVTFSFTGRNVNEQAVKRLEGYQNVEINPPVRPHEVPEIMLNSSVGIIPYTRTEINKNIYPLKINEYLSVGKPVVMTDFADLPEFSEFVHVASTKEEFVDSLKKAMEEKDEALQKRRVEFASANSYESRVAEFHQHIVNSLE